MSAAQLFAALTASLLLAACGTRDVAFHSSTGELAVDVLSFNIRYDTADDGPNSWPHRERLVRDVLRRQVSDNAGEDNPAIRYLKNANNLSPVILVDTFRVLHPEAQAVGTAGGFEGRRDGPKIDYVFVEPDTRVLEAGIIHDNEAGRYPSDHFPVHAKVALPR